MQSPARPSIFNGLASIFHGLAWLLHTISYLQGWQSIFDSSCPGHSGKRGGKELLSHMFKSTKLLNVKATCRRNATWSPGAAALKATKCRDQCSQVIKDCSTALVLLETQLKTQLTDPVREWQTRWGS
jgi:hypothetical protein